MAGVIIPENLESLEKAELIKLIHTLDKERTPSLKRDRTIVESPETPGKPRRVSQGEQSAHTGHPALELTRGCLWPSGPRSDGSWSD